MCNCNLDGIIAIDLHIQQVNCIWWGLVNIDLLEVTVVDFILDYLTQAWSKLVYN